MAEEILPSLDSIERENYPPEEKFLIEETGPPAIGGDTPHGPALFRLEPGMVIWTWVTFLLLLFILGRFAWRPILRKLDERERFIRESLEKAEEVRREVASTSEKQRQALSEAREQAGEIVAKGREAAERIARDIEARAKTEAGKMILDAKAQIQTEKEKAVQQLRMETTDLVIRAASKLLDEDLDDTRHKKLVDAAIETMNNHS